MPDGLEGDHLDHEPAPCHAEAVGALMVFLELPDHVCHHPRGRVGWIREIHGQRGVGSGVFKINGALDPDGVRVDALALQFGARIHGEGVEEGDQPGD